MKSILVTGSSGFIGSKLLFALDKLGYSINLLSRQNYGLYPTKICDFTKDDIPSSALKSIDTVFHLAGYAHDLSGDKNTQSLYEIINVNATINLAKLAIENNVNHFVFISSVKAGGVSRNGNCVKEDDDFTPYGLYAKSKRDAEKKLLEISKNSNMRVLIIRPALVYGPNLKGNLELMWNGIKNDRFLPIPRVKNKKSMVHIDDLISSIIMISKNKNINHEIINVTDGFLYSSREIYETMCKIQNKIASKWSVPKIVLEVVSFVFPNFGLKLKKLIRDDCYSSEKLKSYGFKAQKTLSEMNETLF